MKPRPRIGGRGVVPPVVAVFAVFAAALGLRWLGLDQEPLHDELFNFLAARSWSSGQGFAITPGAEPYDRAWPFTILIGSVMRWFGPTLEVARAVSAVAGAATAAFVTGWLWRSDLRAAGVLGGLLIALDPDQIQLSQISRFYSLFQLAFLVGSVAVCVALCGRRTTGRRITLLLLGGSALCLALSLQIVAVIGIAGLMAFALLWPESVLHRWLLRQWREHRGRLLTLGSTLVALGAVVMVVSGFVDHLLNLATFSDPLTESGRRNVRFYYAWLHDRYASLVVLFPLLVVLAFRRAPRMTFLGISIFGIAFLTHSLLARNAPRYISYATPYFFVMTSLGVVEAFHRLRGWLPRIVEEWHIALSGRHTSLLVLGATVLAFAVGNRAYLETGRVLTRNPELYFPFSAPSDGTLSWSRAEPALEAAAARADVLVSSNPQKALYFLDRLDYIISRNGPAFLEEAGVDPRFARPLISDVDSLKRGACGKRTLVIGETLVLSRQRFSREITRFLRTQGQAIDLPPGSGLEAYWISLPCEGSPANSPGP